MPEGSASPYELAPGITLTACEVLTWLAFGQPHRKEQLLGAPGWLERWDSSNLAAVLEALEVRAQGQCPPERHSDRPGAYQHKLFSPRGPAELRAIRARARRREGRLVTYGELARSLRKEIEQNEREDEQLAQATKRLLAAMRSGAVRTFAHAPHLVEVDRSDLLHRAVTVTVHDEITIDADAPIEQWAGCPKYRDVVFLSDDLGRAKLSPAVPNESIAAISIHQRKRAQAHIEALMRNPLMPPQRKADVAQKIKALFGLKGRGFDQVWAAAAMASGASAWTKAGRKKSRRVIEAQK